MNDLKKEKIAVHCQTLDEAEKLQKKGLELGLYAGTVIGTFKAGYRYFVIKEDYIEYAEHNCDFERQGYRTISASEYLSQFEEVQKHDVNADIRNKLNPISNLVALIEDGAEKHFIDSELKQVKKSIEYLSNLQQQPKYGDKVWVRNSEEEHWTKRIFIDICKGKCRCVSGKYQYSFENGKPFSVISWNYYRTTDSALDKKVLELTKEEAQKELTKLKGEEIKIIE